MFKINQSIKTNNKVLTLIRFKSKQKNDYQKTLNLPNPGKFELSMKKICETENTIKKLANFDTLYKWQIENRKNRPKFVLHDGPPYANGDIHIGHMVNKVLKDINLRYKMLSGYQIDFLPGWDCHGLPIELNALKALNKSKTNKSRPTTSIEIRKLANDFAQKWIQTQIESFKQMNLIADWNKIYRTIDTDYMCNELDLFHDLYEKKLIYRDYMPVYWSVSSQTALAEFELEYNNEHKSNALYVGYQLVKYPLKIREALKDDQFLFAPIWTTTPWSLPCNKAIAFNPNLKYGVVVNPDNKAYLIANDLIEYIQKNIPVFKDSVKLNVEVEGSMLKRSLYTTPFALGVNEFLPLLPSEHVGNKQGTGLVHIAPALGHDDFKLGVKYNLETDCVIDEHGKYTNSDGMLNQFELNGKSVLDPQTIKEIKDILGELIIYEHDHIHSYPYDWRTKKPCIIRSSMQWFIDTNKLKNDSLEKLVNVKIRPSNVSNSMNATLKSRPYWCISRQRSWGLPIPCFYKVNLQNKQEPVINKEFIKKIKELIKKEGNIDFWWTNKYDDELKSTLNNEPNLIKSKDIFDIWFDSGSSFNSVLNPKQVADLYCEGVDQFSGWFQSSLLLSIALNNQAPYKSILVHGFVVDENNRKMSKSIGNVIEPIQAIKGIPNKLPQCGLDVLRFWVAHEYYKPQIQIGSNILEKFLKRTFEIRSILRFIVGNLNEDDLKNKLITYDSMLPIDKYILSQMNHLLESVNESYEDMNLSKAITSIENFFLTQLSSFYIKLIRDRLYCEKKDSLERKSCQTALYYILTKSLVMIAPIMPHLAEEAFFYSILKKDSQNNDYSLFRSNLNFSLNPEWKNKNIEDLFVVINQMRDQFNEIIQSDKSTLFQVDLECNHILFDKLKDSNASLIECFGCSFLTLKLNHQMSSNFKLTVSKLDESKVFVCARCRRHTSFKQNELCSRCTNAIV